MTRTQALLVGAHPEKRPLWMCDLLRKRRRRSTVRRRQGVRIVVHDGPGSSVLPPGYYGGAPPAAGAAVMTHAGLNLAYRAAVEAAQVDAMERRTRR